MLPVHKIIPAQTRFLLLCFLLWGTYSGFAQNCPQNNLNVAEVFFFDTDGTPFTEDMEFEPGTVIDGQIFVQFGGSANNAYSLYFAYDLIVNDEVLERNVLCLFQGSNVIKDKPQFITNFSLTWGDKLEFGNIFMRWYTNTSPDCPGPTGGAAQCYSNPGTFRVNTPFIPLPVIWENYTLKKSPDDQSLIIHWSTSREWDSSHFEIERSVGDIKQFKVIGRVTSVGWSDKVSEYSFTDPRFPDYGGRLYYRIKQVDLDGSYAFSPTLMAEPAQGPVTNTFWNAYPNPVSNNELKLRFNGKDPQDLVQVRIYSMSSNFSATFRDPGSYIDLSQAIKNFPKGVMIIQITTKDHVESIKVLKR
jgi:hypothetical protein